MLFAASGDFVRAAAFVLEALAATNAPMVSTVPSPSPAALFGRRKGVHEG